MKSAKLTNINALIYYLSKVSKIWYFQNPYHIALKSLLNGNGNIRNVNIRKEQDFHFVAKIIIDELNKNLSEIKNNCKEFERLIISYIKDKQENKGDRAIRILFYILILKLLNKKNHSDRIKKQKINNFLKIYSSKESNLINFHRLLSLYYTGSITEIKEDTIKDNLDLAVSLLYDRLLLSNNKNRDKNILLDYYIKQNSLEDIDTESVSSDRTKANLLEIAIILKSATGEGIYLPEIEKEQYLSQFSIPIIKEKYLSILENMTHIKIFKIKIPYWIMFLIFFLFECLIFILPNFIESISIGSFSVSTTALINLPLWIIILINGIIVSLFVWIIQQRTKKTISDEKWR